MTTGSPPNPLDALLQTRCQGHVAHHAPWYGPEHDLLFDWLTVITHMTFKAMSVPRSVGGAAQIIIL